MKFTTIALFSLALAFGACKKDKKDETAPTATTGATTLQFAHSWDGNSDFALETSYTRPNTGETMEFAHVKYYISNIRLRKADGSWYVQPNSYFLLDLANPASTDLAVGSLPAGDYTTLEFTFGVDSLHNVSGAQSGALSPANQMFWNWNTGYIMSKAEGVSPDAPNGSFAFHLGGFQGPNSVVITKTINLSALNTLNVTAGSNTAIGIGVDLAAMFADAPTLAVTSDIMGSSALAKAMALSFVTEMELTYVND